MKKRLLLFFILLVGFTQAQIVNIPDPVFKNALVNLNVADFDGDGNTDGDVDTNDDGEIQVSEAEAVIGLNLPSGNVETIKGIESFINIEVLDVWYNQIEFLDLNQNPNLKFLDCSSNDLISIDITQNPNLEYLNCNFNDLINLNITQNPNLKILRTKNNDLTLLNVGQNHQLEWLYCRGNFLTELDVTQNSNLTKLDCSSNDITDIDVSQNLLLIRFWIEFNNLTTLDVSNNLNLERLDCGFNLLENLDLSQNSNLGYLRCSSNQLTNIDLSQNHLLGSIDLRNNQLENLNINNGFNFILGYFDGTDNPNLFCIQVDDENYAYNHPNWHKDPWTEYSEDCEYLSIEEIELSSKFNIYPNPVTDLLTIANTSNTEITSIKLYDVLGRLVMEVFEGLDQIDVSHLNSSVLFLEIETNQGVVTKKIVKE